MASKALNPIMSSMPDYRKLLEDLAKEIEASKKKLNLDALESEADVQVPVQTPAVPDYEALRNGLSKIWKERQEKNSLDATIELLCYADVVFARFAVLTEYMRIKEAEHNRTNGIEKLDKAKIQLLAYGACSLPVPEFANNQVKRIVCFGSSVCCR